MHIGEAAHLPETQPHREIAPTGFFERAIPMAVIDRHGPHLDAMLARIADDLRGRVEAHRLRSEEHTSELQSLMRISYAVFCLKKKKKKNKKQTHDSNIR